MTVRQCPRVSHGSNPYLDFAYKLESQLETKNIIIRSIEHLNVIYCANCAKLNKSNEFKLQRKKSYACVVGKCPETTAHVFAKELLGQ